MSAGSCSFWGAIYGPYGSIATTFEEKNSDFQRGNNVFDSRRTAEEPEDALSRELDALRYDVGELKARSTSSQS